MFTQLLDFICPLQLNNDEYKEEYGIEAGSKERVFELRRVNWMDFI